jgi:drug/metabolite transporter (DMT)-like permease
MMAAVDPSVVIGVALACVASCLFNGSIVIQAGEARQESSDLGLQLGLLGRLIRRPRWLAGAGLNVIALVLQTVALLFAPVTAVQPADAAGLLLLLFLGTRVLGERVGRVEIGAVVAILAGIALLTASAPKREVTHVNGAGVLVPLIVVALIAVAPLLLRRLVAPRSLLVVFGAGFAFALAAFAIKLIADSLSDGSWLGLVAAAAIAGFGAFAGTLAEQTALQQRPATQVAPIIFVVELLVPVGLALTVVGENWGGSVPAIAVALVLIVAGVVALARAPQVAGLLGE